MKTQEKFKKNQTEWNNSNIDICDFNAFFSKQQKEGGKHIKKYIFLFVVFRLRLRINHNLQVSCFFFFSLVQACFISTKYISRQSVYRLFCEICPSTELKPCKYRST